MPDPLESALVTLPTFAPSSPTSIPHTYLEEIEHGNPVTPGTSPSPETPPPPLPPRSSTPRRFSFSSQPSQGAGSWDNFLEDPSYQENQEFWISRSTVKKVKLVSTDISDIEDSSEWTTVTSSQVSVLDQGIIESMSMTMIDSAAALRELETGVRDMCSDLDPDLVTADVAPNMTTELKHINEARNEYRKGVRKFLQDYADELSSSEKLAWESDMAGVVKLVNQHKFQVMAKVNQVAPPPAPMSAFEQATIDLQKQQLVIQQQEVSNKKEEALAVAEPIRKLVIEKCKELDEELEQTEISQLVVGEDQLVSRTMMKISEWRKALDRISDIYQDFQCKTAVYRLSSQEHTEVSAAFKRTKDSFISLVSVAEDQDQKRQLFSLDTSNKGEQVKWPTFSGESGEDFFKFKKEFLDAAIQNKTSTKNQITKLKENLKGYAKSLVPPSITDIKRALEILEHACGDSMKVVQHRVEKMMSVGPWPSDGSKDCYSKQVKWLVKVQTLLQEIVDLANTEEELADVIYNKEKLAQILKLFPTFMVDKLVKIPGYKEVKYKKIIEKLEEFKETSQNREMIFGPGGISSSQKDKAPAAHQPHSDKPPTGHTFFPKPSYYADCRICKVLQTQGETGLFEKHVSDYATGCPKFAGLGNEQRLVVATEAKFCLKCMNKDVKFNRQHMKECPTISKKNSYSCKFEKCSFHMWVCNKHQDENKVHMERLQEQLRIKSGLKLVFVVTKAREERPAKDVTGSPHSYFTSDRVGIKRAVRNLNRFNKKSDPDVVTVSPPEGVALFMFQGVEGLNNPVYTFYDSGCSEAIFREEIPGKELRGTVLAKGPFQMGAVGNTPVVAEEEWLVQMSREDGKKQLIRGVTMKQITCDFPLADTTKAEAEVRASDPKDKLLQGCKLPKIVGGRVDVLLGIHYSNIHPVSIRQLDCGLTIYKSRLTSHDKSVNALIGGPHSSFQFLAEKAGNVGALLAHFTQGLQQLRQLGPPRIPINPLSVEEELFAINHNATESEEVKQLVDLERFGDSSDQDGKVPVPCAPEQSSTPIPSNPVHLSSRSWHDVQLEEGNGQGRGEAKRDHVSLSSGRGKVDACSNVYPKMGIIQDTENTETLREIRRLRLEQECGMDLNYRCIKCRACSDCKDSDRTESVSLREEAEMHKIDQSVTLNLEEKVINCTLPLRGEEREFLSTNFYQANKVLEQQCKLYNNQVETKELIIKAFNKLFDNGHAALVQDLTVDEKTLFENKEVQYFIPWRIAFSDSTTTPARPVLDASSRTRTRLDGTGGKSLNNLVCQGKVDTINLLKLVLGFRVGKVAVTGDLEQFYNSFKLLPNQWNLQRFLFKRNLDPRSPVEEGVIKTLIYGVASVSAQSECGKRKLGNLVKDEKPDVKKIIDDRMYVDDAGDSRATKEECIKLAADCDEVFARVNLKCKAWNFSGMDPDDKVSKDGVSLGVGGMRWFPKLDFFELKVPHLHFGKRRRGKLKEDTKFFSGNQEELDQFTPRKLSRRMVCSKFASIYDLTGKLGPVMAAAKDLLRDTIEATEDWDTAMPDNLRDKWLKQFLLWEKLRGLKFNRAVMPEDAVDSKMRLILCCDFAQKMQVVGCWGGFRRKSGEWSCQHLLSRNLLAEKNQTIPKGELQSLTNASNMAWLLRKLLSEWVNDYIICGDSVIALCWVSTEKKSLSMFHRNRVIQIRRGSELDHIYHVKTEENVADLGTRPERVKITDVGPDSVWECGKPWMHWEVSKAVEKGILKPISEVRSLEEKESDDYKEGLIFGNDIPDVMCNTVKSSRVDFIHQRAEFSKYLVLPTKFGFKKVVRIMALVLTFISKCRRKATTKLKLDMAAMQDGFKFTLFFVQMTDKEISGNDDGAAGHPNDLFGDGDKQLIEVPEEQSSPPIPSDPVHLSSRSWHDVQLEEGNGQGRGEAKSVDEPHKPESSHPTDKYIHQALMYFFKKATQEVLQFNSSAKVEKIAIMKEGILFSKSRIIDGVNYAETGGLEVNDLNYLGIKAHTPVIDRFSPLAYAIASYVHNDLAKHRGMETCNRISLGQVSIIQGANLYKELGEQCIRCRMKRKKYLEVPMGPISDHQLRVCPPFWAAQADIFGPIQVYVPGFEKNTRNRNVLQAKCWVLVFVCPVTRLTNIQVIEKSDNSGMIDGVTRLSCEVGVPKFILVDDDSALVKAVQEVEINLLNTQLALHTEYGIEFSICPVSGHNQHGQVERKIRSIKDSLKEAGFQNKRLHATGFQTLLKLIENQLNNFPLGYVYGRDQDNNPLLKMITPNMLRVGRSNERALDGPMRMPKGDGELLKEVEKTYNSWFKVWNASYVPKLVSQPKWFRQDRDLLEGDIVMFQKSESSLDSRWTLGTVDQLVRSRDGLVRRVIVRYQNAKEDVHRLTDRNLRRLVKIWSCDDLNTDEELAELQKKLRETGRKRDLIDPLVRDLQGDDVRVPPLQPPPQVHHDVSSRKDQCASLQTMLARRSFEPVPDLGQSLLSGDAVSGDWSDEMIESESGVEQSCVCSLSGILESLHFNLN